MPSPTHPADRHALITVTGATENNLKHLTLSVPKRRLTVFAGVSGSGKSSLVFGTIAAEAQRLVNETYSAFIQGFMPAVGRPEVEHLEGLTATIVVDQERLGAHARSTVGTVSDINATLRLLWSRASVPYVGPPNAFSFNVPSVRGGGSLTVERGGGQVLSREFVVTGGMCPRCEGMGHVNDINLQALFDERKSLAEGALSIPGYTVDGWQVRLYTGSGFVNPHVPIQDLSPEERHNLLYREPTKVKIDGINLTYEGLIPKLQKSMLSKDLDAMQPHIRAFVERAVTFSCCPECEGTRLSEKARTATVDGLTLAEACRLPIESLLAWASQLQLPALAPLLTRLRHSLQAFVDIGLGYLSLERPSGTLSGGEAQRTKMARHVGSPLTDVTYVFDEPSVGLHPHDITRLNRLLLQLRDQGNTVLVVEHKPETIAIADHVVELGPLAGAQGGQIVFEGSVEALRHAQTLTGQSLQTPLSLKAEPRQPTGWWPIRNATLHNLKQVDVDVPLGCVVALTGVAGSGKSSLVKAALAHQSGVCLVDQTPIKGSRRSNPATYTDLLEPIRKAFAKANGVKPALFSANSEGACPSCKGAGLIEVDLGPHASTSTLCEDCEGRRFQAEVLQYTWGGKSIADVFELSVSEALTFFGQGPAKLPAVLPTLTRLNEVGLGYVHLGQPLNTLSGGERQRLKLASEMAEGARLYVLDEPSAGLHLADIAQLTRLLERLIHQGCSVLLIEHHLSLIAQADWVIDMGPGAGQAGGQVVFSGTPQALIAHPQSLTGRYLARALGSFSSSEGTPAASVALR